MKYYEVLAGSSQYHGSKPLTYKADQDIKPGTIVLVPIRGSRSLGIVLSSCPKPDFQVKPIDEILLIPPLPKPNIELLTWLTAYYPAGLGSIVALFVPRSLNNKLAKIEAGKVAHTKEINVPKLTKEQSTVLQRITTDQSRSFLLHGDTGTGKTRIYLELAIEQLEAGKNVLILTPEIGLTPQLVKQFENSLGRQVIVLHSNLTDKQRRQAWLRLLLNKEPVVVIGPRSALFAPFQQLGLIVVDEAHDSAYKQDQSPHYQAIRVAAKLAELHKAIFIMGSATPTISDYYYANAKRIPILRMQKLAIKHSNPPSTVTIIKANDRQQFNKNPYLSDKLLEAIDQRLQRSEQSLIFLNRRGTARIVLCQQCSWQALCPNCDLPLTYHGDNHLMRCHTCGYKTAAISACPVCGNTEILYRSMGTKAVVDSLVHLFPRARIQRFDGDTKKAERFEQHFNRIVAGDVDILVGTQILVKGLDLPKLSLVGVISADHSLAFPDYTAEEHTFQILNQIIGRVGRGHIQGEAIIQTFHPDSLTIQAAITKDWDHFYNAQLKERETYLFPPFCYLLKLSCTRKTIASVRTGSQLLVQSLRKLPLKIQVIGPSPSFYEKSKKGYTWQVIIKAKDRSQLLQVIAALPSGWNYDLDPANLL